MIMHHMRVLMMTIYIIYTDIAPTDPLMPNDTDNDENYEFYDR